jgi:hypothetical protein
MDMKYKLILFFCALLVPISLQDQQRLNYGVVFQSHTNVDFASDVWTHTFEIPLYIHVRVTIDEMTKCSLRNRKYCLILHQLSDGINMVRKKLKSQLTDTKNLTFNMVPELTRPLTSRSKRALLPFVGDLSRSIFGIATTGDVNKLAQHVNQLTRRENKVTRALQRYGGVTFHLMHPMLMIGFQMRLKVLKAMGTLLIKSLNNFR